MACERTHCLRCGAYILAARRRRKVGSDYCTNRCAKAQERDDRESAAQEKLLLEDEGYGGGWSFGEDNDVVWNLDS